MTYNQLDTSTIFDFETLSQDRITGAVISLALLNFDVNRFNSRPYTYRELLDQTEFIKFDVKDQIEKYGRKIEKETLDWWGKQSPEALKQLDPSPEDQSISKLYDFWIENVPTHNTRKVYSRNNTFDPLFLEYMLKACGKPLPYDFWKIRDTKSLIDGMTWGADDIEDNFIPEGLESLFVAHDPRHDIAMDVMRIQYLSRILGDTEEDEIPF